MSDKPMAWAVVDTNGTQCAVTYAYNSLHRYRKRLKSAGFHIVPLIPVDWACKVIEDYRALYCGDGERAEYSHAQYTRRVCSDVLHRIRARFGEPEKE